MWLRAGSLLFALPAVILLSLYGIEMSALTDCTQSGGHYDFINGVCSDSEQPQISYYQRHTILVNLMMLVSIAGTFAMVWGMMLRGMSRPKD
ncbi:hypothetical protein [Thalassolituus marinus]|jgi:hypothetical protein|uniref:Uncharacterized protein n=1 Tax=Thalassolituus marinus TaxID=671053 RepID=A0ABS7ZJX0_9GAMM|nr:hypothetical protein [Thalassolituus marinus]MCA6062002.1 hypothetical protein [Thalassolituus marinus]